MGDQPCRKAATYTGQHKHRRNADTHPCLEWHEPIILVFERVETYHTSDHAATAIGKSKINSNYYHISRTKAWQ
jgi:hypothetical protein